jgi:RNA polymerase sigma-70 factor, ECF subfamily
MKKPVHAPPTLDTDEAELVGAAQAHPSAFALLYQQYLPRVYHYVRARMETDEDAADLTQQIFLQALDALPTYQPRGVPFVAWLFQIARHAVIDMHRRRKSVISWDALPAAFHTPTGYQDMDAQLVHQERLVRLKTLLADLNPLQRELLTLRFAAGLSTPQIALVVGKSPAAVKKQLTRLLHTLKEQYHEQ